MIFMNEIQSYVIQLEFKKRENSKRYNMNTEFQGKKKCKVHEN